MAFKVVPGIIDCEVTIGSKVSEGGAVMGRDPWLKVPGWGSNGGRWWG